MVIFSSAGDGPESEDGRSKLIKAMAQPTMAPANMAQPWEGVRANTKRRSQL